MSQKKIAECSVCEVGQPLTISTTYSDIPLALAIGDIIRLITNLEYVYWSNTTMFIGRI